MAATTGESVGATSSGPAPAAAAWAHFQSRLADIRRHLQHTIVGQETTIDLLLACALSESHALLVGVPGLAKTLLVKALAACCAWQFNRVQFTPDLMPADITGYELLDPQNHAAMIFRPGPVFANLVLADEINRAAPKTQSALLEAMAERHVTVGGRTHLLPAPFLVVATQNPIEQEGTYPLPEAQLDRFMMQITLDYPTPREEEQIVRRTSSAEPALPPALLSPPDWAALIALVQAVPVPDSTAALAVRLCGLSRPADPRADAYIKNYLAWGAGPRGSQNLVRAAKAWALLQGRPTPTVEDVRHVAAPVLGHRLILHHRALGDGVTVAQVLDHLLRHCG